MSNRWTTRPHFSVEKCAARLGQLRSGCFVLSPAYHNKYWQPVILTECQLWHHRLVYCVWPSRPNQRWTCKTNDESIRDETSDALSFRHDLSVFVARSLHGVVLSSFIGVRVCFLSSASVFDVQHGDEREKKLKEGAKKKDFLSIFFCPSSFLSAHLFPTQIDPWWFPCCRKL